MEANHQKRAFEGIRIVDLTHVIAGPFGTYQLGLMGAEVIKIERPREGDMTRGRGGPEWEDNVQGMGWCYRAQGGNKKAVCIDLKSVEGKAVFLKLVGMADVLVSNFKPGKMAKLGLHEQTLERVNSSLIVASLAGFNKVSRGAYDNTIQASSGIVDALGAKTSCPFVDFASGWCLAFAISSALLQRERFGRRFQSIDVSMFDVALTCFSPAFASAERRQPGKPPIPEAGLDRYKTKDDKEIMLGVYR